MSERFPITSEGYKLLEAELKDLKTVQRPRVSEEIAAAREHGDLKENAEYHAAREKQSFIEGRVMELEHLMASADIIDVNQLGGETVKFGATITLVDDDDAEMTYQIVGEYEADIKSNKISIKSPIARALIGKSAGDYVEVSTPRGEKGYEILAVAFL